MVKYLSLYDTMKRKLLSDVFLRYFISRNSGTAMLIVQKKEVSSHSEVLLLTS